MSIRITRVRAEHSGETKFYQVFKIQDTKTGRGAVVTHWGALKPGAPEEPRLFGQSKVATGTTFRLVQDCYNDPIRNKRKRGYMFGSDHIEFDGTFPAADTELRRWFKDADVKKIEDALLPDDTEEDVSEDGEEPNWDDAPYGESEEGDNTPTVQPETIKTETVQPSHNEWGTW